MTLAPDTLQLIEQHGRPALVKASRHALWRAGDLSWLLHDGVAPRNRGQSQVDAAFQQAREAGVRRFMLNIGRRWGKSHYFCVKACEMALSGPKRRIPYAAMSAVSLRQFVLPIMRSVVDTAPDDVKPVFVGNELRFRNGSFIVMQGCEDRSSADSLRGPEAHMAIVDEAGFLRSEILEYVVRSVLLFQLGTTGGMMLIGSSPPETPDHAFHTMFAEAQERGAAFHAEIYDAPHLTSEAIRELAVESGGENSVTWKREARAQFLVDPKRALVVEWSVQTGLDEENAKQPGWLPIVREVERPEHFHAYIVGDLGYVDLTFVLFAYWHFKLAAIVVEDEYVAEKTTSDVIQRACAQKEHELWTESGIVGPATRAMDAPRITVADLSRLQDKGDPTEKDSWSMAWTGDLVAGLNHLRLDVGFRRFIVHPRCKLLRLHLANGIWNERRTSFERSAGTGHFDGVSASVYLSRTVDRTKNPYPMVRPSNLNAWVPPQPKLGSEWGHQRKVRR